MLYSLLGEVLCSLNVGELRLVTEQEVEVSCKGLRLIIDSGLDQTVS